MRLPFCFAPPVLLHQGGRAPVRVAGEPASPTGPLVIVPGVIVPIVIPSGSTGSPGATTARRAPAVIPTAAARAARAARRPRTTTWRKDRVVRSVAGQRARQSSARESRHTKSDHYDFGEPSPGYFPGGLVSSVLSATHVNLPVPCRPLSPPSVWSNSPEWIKRPARPRIGVSPDRPHRRNRRDEQVSVLVSAPRVITGEGLLSWSDLGLRSGPTLVGWDGLPPHAILGSQAREGDVRNGCQRALEDRAA